VKPVWLNDVERDAWVERHCRVCFQPDEARKRITGDGPGCPHLARAERNKLPTPWTRRRNAVMGETYRCADFAKQPPVNRRQVSTEETPPLLEVPSDDRHLVPVDGWPDYRSKQRKTKEGDHQ
jgi:putative SOS response-associated peptidase YedK